MSTTTQPEKDLEEIDYGWDFHHDMDNQSYQQEHENQKLKKQLELAKTCIADLRNLGFHNEAVKVTADQTSKDIKALDDAPVNMHRLKGYGF